SSDLLTMTISNRVSLILVGGFVALAAIGGVRAADLFWHFAPGWRRLGPGFVGLAAMGGVSAADVLSHLAAGCVVLVAAFSLFARGVIGGGDAKLAAATGLWLGVGHLFPRVVYAAPT